MRNSDLYPDRGSDDMLGALIDSVSERVAERICSRIEEKLQHRQRIQQTSQSTLLSSPDSEEDQLITKAETCHLPSPCRRTRICEEPSAAFCLAADY